MEEKRKIQFITCPVCSGSGKNKIGLACANCNGMGMGVFVDGIFYYWGPKLGLAVIKLSHTRRFINKLVNVITFFIGIIGVLSLALWLWQNSSVSPEYIFFWRFKHGLLFIFWFSLLFDMFMFYRVSEEEAAKQKIKKLNFKKNKKTIYIPDNWEELKKYKYKVDVSRGHGERSMQAIEDAFVLAKKLKHNKVEIMHLFSALLKDEAILAFFSRLNVNIKSLAEKVKNSVLKYNNTGKTELSQEVKKALIEAYIASMNLSQKKVKARNLILPCQENDKILAEILYDFEINGNKLINCLAWFRIDDKLREQYRIYKKMARFKPGSNMDRAYTSIATPVLNHFARDLTIAAKSGRLEFAVAREKEINSIFQQLESGHTGIILSGEEGVGKNTIINGIAQLMVEENVPKILKDKRLVKLDVARLISGATATKAQERLLVAIDEIIRAGNIILYIDNIENIIGIKSGEGESLDLSEVLAGAIERGSIYCLATTSSKNYSRYVESKSLGNAMANIKIKEPDENQAIQMIESKIGPLEAKHDIYFSYNAIENVVKLSNKYMHDKYLPEKAVKLLELVSVKVAQSRGEKSIVTKEDIAKIVSETTGIPISKVTEDEGRELLNLEEKIHERMINQEEAVNMVASSLRRARAELHEKKRPIASFLFMGPTGVGKTELAKSVSQIYFGNEKNMIRLDMSEYQHPDSIKKMIGSVSGERGYLTEAVRKNPFSLILLDEFEKAHPDILNLFLQVMDDGRLTDGQGNTIDFTNSIIISTSNAGAVYIQDEISRGANIEKIKEVLINEKLNKIMRPELINRFDGIVVFKPLSRENVRDITELMLKKFEKTLDKKGIRMRVESGGINILAEEGYDPKFGARPLRRLLQDKVENIIANKILEGELKRRDTVIIDNLANIQIEKAKIL